MTSVSRSIIINSPREKVFDVITDFGSYPQFLSDMKKVVVEKSSSKEIVASFELQIVTTLKYRLKLKLTRPSTVTWKMIEGQLMKKNDGGWKLKALSPKRTEATYTIDVEMGAFIPKSITNNLIGNNLPAMLESFKKRIEKG